MGIQFLACTPVESLDTKVQMRTALEISEAALVGDTIFNFGEVLAQPILKVLDGSENEWLHTMLKVFSAGDIDGFTEVCQKNEAAIKASPLLNNNMEILRQKIALLC